MSAIPRNVLYKSTRAILAVQAPVLFRHVRSMQRAEPVFLWKMLPGYPPFPAPRFPGSFADSCFSHVVVVAYQNVQLLDLCLFL